MNYKYRIYAIFFATGISGLMYEVVWLRMLSRITGVTLYATATVLTAFMAGLALGSFLLGRLADKRNDGLRIYAILELLVGLLALFIPLVFSALVPVYQFIYEVTGENTFITAAVRCVLSFLALLVPTTMMGGTLPILTSYLVKRNSSFGKSFSLLYGLNTFGAVLGVLLSGFLTIGWLGEMRTIYLGVAINLTVAFVAWLLHRADARSVLRHDASPALAERSTGNQISSYSDGVRRVVLIVFTISGFTALSYEVIWTRQLILFCGTSIYAFSGMLAVFLSGIAFGSMVLSRELDRIAKPVEFFALLELGIGLLSIAGLYLFYPLDSMDVWTVFGCCLPILAVFLLVFPITFFFGMIFPIAALCYAKNTSRAGTSVGALYSANTVGSILGSLFTGFLLVPHLGSTNSMIILASINVALAFLLLFMESGKSTKLKLCYTPIILVFAVVVFGASTKDPFLAAIERRIFLYPTTEEEVEYAASQIDIYFNKECIEGTVTAFSQFGSKGLWVNGVGMTILCTETKLMTHLPMMYAKNPKEFLIICFGMGSSFRSAMCYPDLNITAVELVSEEFKLFNYYHPGNEEYLTSPNVHLIANDGRNSLLLSPKQYDVITIDPAPPIWSAGTVNLYSQEFFRLCKSRLTTDGVMCLWLPSDSCDDDYFAILRTFSEVFQNTIVWSGPHKKWGFYLIGTMRDVPDAEFNDKMRQAFEQPVILKDLQQIDDSCSTVEQLEELRWLDSKSIGAVAEKGELITDDNPYTEFILWRYLRGKLSRKTSNAIDATEGEKKEMPE